MAYREEAHLPFGKHKGRRLRDVPTPYLRWLLTGASLDGWLAEAVAEELRRRGERHVPAAAVLDDLEEKLAVRVSEDDALDHETAGRVSDHVLLAFEDLRAEWGIGQATELTIHPPGEPRRGGHHDGEA